MVSTPSFLIRATRQSREVCQLINPLIIGITGSAGKTSTRDAIYAALKNNYKIKVSYKANSESGIPLNILGITPEHFSLAEWLKLILLCPVKLLTNWDRYDIYLVELGIDSPLPPKNMSYLLSILKPNIGVLLNAAPMHSEPFDYLVSATDPQQRAKEVTKLIANEKGKIITEIDSTQTAVVNIDQEEFVALLPQVTARLVSFGTSTDADVRILDYKVSTTGTSFKFDVESEKIELQFTGQLLPEHFAHTFAASIAVAFSLGMSVQTIKNALETNFKLPPSRSTLIEGINGSTIIDSSYNASTKPMIDMLTLLAQLPGKKKYAL